MSTFIFQKSIKFKMIKWFSFLLIGLLPTLARSQHAESDWNKITVTSLDGRLTKLALSEKKITAFIILGVDCPISRKYIPAIEDIKNAYPDKLEWVAVFPSYFSIDEVTLFKEEYILKVPCYVDHEMALIRQLNASVTPEVFLIDQNFKLQYHGAIDDWFYDLGHYRTKITQRYLKDAIECLLNGNKIKNPAVKATGCPIPLSPSHQHDHRMQH